MTASSRAVAAICASAAVTVQASITALSSGTGRPVAVSTMARNSRREGQAEQKADVRGADRAQRGRQLLLHGVAHRLAGGGHDREHGP